MTSKKNKARSARELSRKIKKKTNPVKLDKVEYIDYKDTTLLQKFMSDRSKIRGRRLIGTTVQEQRELTNAIKNAREMALLPYTKRVTSTRAPRPGADRREEGADTEATDQTDVEALDLDIDDAVETAEEVEA
jgi:small subunit ribosomal protein S18